MVFEKQLKLHTHTKSRKQVSQIAVHLPMILMLLFSSRSKFSIFRSLKLRQKINFRMPDVSAEHLQIVFGKIRLKS